MVAVHDKYEVKAYCRKGDQAGINVRHFEVVAVTSSGLTDVEIADDLSSLIASAYKPWMAGNAEYLGCTVQNQTTAPFPAPSVSTIGAGIGTRSGDNLPLQVAGQIHLQSANSGRHGRGRVYVPFGSEVFNESGAIVSTVGVVVLDAIGALWKGPLVLSRILRNTALGGCIKNRVSGVFTPITRTVPDDRWATQRRRSNFGRQNPIPFE